MAYNLQSRLIRVQLREEDRQGDFVVDLNNDEMETAVEDHPMAHGHAHGRPISKLTGKNGFVWTGKSPMRRSDWNTNTFPPIIPGPANAAANLDTLEEFWDILFNADIIQIIVNKTNIKIEAVCAALVVQNKVETYHHHTDVKEIRALIGVLYYAGLWKSSGINDNRLWDKKNGITLYRCVFGRNRFSFLMSCLRFEDRKKGTKYDKFAPIRRIWDIFIGNSQRYYTPSNKCTVDEQFLNFRGRCAFRMCVKSKPDKYGLKLIALNDAETSYLINAIPYLGKNSVTVRDESKPEYFFRQVTTPIHGTNRTVTCNNWFTTIPLLEKMLQDPFNMTITGRIKKNNPEIPVEMKVASEQPPSSNFCHAPDLTLVCYTPKKKKILLVASSYLHTTEITGNKPNIVLHYNETKGGTKCFEQLCHSYTVKRKARRWPMRIFFEMIDQAIVNARILWKCKLLATNKKKKTNAIVCLNKIFMHLVTPYLMERYEQPNLRKSLKIAIAGILNKNVNSGPKYKKVQLQSRQRCAFCTRKEDKKTKEACSLCKRPICDTHRLMFCNECSGV